MRWLALWLQAPKKGAVINPLITCGRYDYCENGRSNLCLKHELIGMRLSGAYADYVSIPTKNLIEIPDSFSAVHAALTEPAAAALHSLNLARKRSDRPLAELEDTCYWRRCGGTACSSPASGLWL